MRTRWPMAAKMALQIAGATGGNAGSPTPVGGLSLWMKCTSTLGWFGDAQDRVLVEVRLLDAAVLHRDLQSQHRAVAVDDAAFALIVRAAHVDDGSDVAGDHHAMQADALVRIHADLGDFGEMPGMAEMEREAHPMSRGQLAAPAGFLGDELDDVGGAAGVESARQQARLAHHLEQEVAMIAPGGRGQLVQETLDDPGHGARTRRAPRPAGRASGSRVCVSW